jgi:hypothetical protein
VQSASDASSDSLHSTSSESSAAAEPYQWAPVDIQLLRTKKDVLAYVDAIRNLPIVYTDAQFILEEMDRWSQYMNRLDQLLELPFVSEKGARSVDVLRQAIKGRMTDLKLLQYYLELQQTTAAQHAVANSAQKARFSLVKRALDQKCKKAPGKSKSQVCENYLRGAGR